VGLSIVKRSARFAQPKPYQTPPAFEFRVIKKRRALVAAPAIIHDLYLAGFEVKVFPHVWVVHDAFKGVQRRSTFGVHRLIRQFVAVHHLESRQATHQFSIDAFKNGMAQYFRGAWRVFALAIKNIGLV